MDKGNPKRANGEVTRGKEGEGDIPLSGWAKPVERGKKWREKKEREKRGEEKMREKLLILSSFLGDPAFSVCQSKRKSSSSRRELRPETRIREFHQTLRGRGFFLLGFNF